MTSSTPTNQAPLVTREALQAFTQRLVEQFAPEQVILNLDGSLSISGPIPPGPCLLIDDMVDSRWTFTVAAWLLRENGSGRVFPLALAQTG